MGIMKLIALWYARGQSIWFIIHF